MVRNTPIDRTRRVRVSTNVTPEDYQALLDKKKQSTALINKANRLSQKHKHNAENFKKQLDEEKQAKEQMRLERDEARADLEDLQQKLDSALSELKCKGRSATFEQKGDIVKYLYGWVKVTAYRTHKFLETDRKKERIVKDAYKVMKRAFNMDVKEDPNFLILAKFHCIYLPVLQEAIPKCRQYTQTKLQGECEGQYNVWQF